MQINEQYLQEDVDLALRLLQDATGQETTTLQLTAIVHTPVQRTPTPQPTHAGPFIRLGCTLHAVPRTSCLHYWLNAAIA